jgi:UDP-4-amino-4,6-dideoxy-N-acetyl-beta-L-altrosamine N-acetyltransferase
MLETYRLLRLVDLNKETQLDVLKIRNEESIRKWMFTDHIIDVNEHLSWIDGLKSDKSQMYLIIMDDNTIPHGAVYLSNIDICNKKSDLGFYGSPVNKKRGLITACLVTLIDYAFNVLGIEKISGEVLEENIMSFNLHKKLLFREEGFRRSHILRDGRRIGIHLFGLLKDEWLFEKSWFNNCYSVKILPSTTIVR